MQFTLGPERLQCDFKFTIPDEITSIGIGISGGIDSTILLCAILSELSDTNRLGKVKVKAYTFMKTEASTFYAHRLLEKIKKIYNAEVEHENNVDNDMYHHTRRIAPEAWDNISVRKETDVFYWGLNNQVDAKIKTFTHNLNHVYKTPDEAKSQRFNLYPFLTMSKPNMLDLYFKLGVDHLIPYTHSCSRGPDKCNACYSCEERAWGFEELGLTDIVAEPETDPTFGGTYIRPQ